MYNDNPYMKLSRKSVEAVFKNHNVRIDIGGTTKSIKNITKEEMDISSGTRVVKGRTLISFSLCLSITILSFFLTSLKLG